MTHVDFALRLGQQRAQELRQLSRNAARRGSYPDRERQPRILRHWANRL